MMSRIPTNLALPFLSRALQKNLRKWLNDRILPTRHRFRSNQILDEPESWFAPLAGLAHVRVLLVSDNCLITSSLLPNLESTTRLRCGDFYARSGRVSERRVTGERLCMHAVQERRFLYRGHDEIWVKLRQKQVDGGMIGHVA